MDYKDVNRILPESPENSAEPLAPEILRRIQQKLVDDLRPVRPLIASKFLLLGFTVIFVAIVGAGVYYLRPFGIAVLSPVQLTTIIGTLAVSAGMLAYSLTRHMVPGSSHHVPSRILLIAAPLALLIEMSILFHFQHETQFWAKSRWCLSIGLRFAAVAALPFWFILRRGAILCPQAAGAAAGLLAGLVGTSVLEMHCRNLDAWHILSSHLLVAVLSLLGGLAIGSLADLFSRRAAGRRR